MKPRESTGNAAESLQKDAPRAPPGSNWIQPVPNPGLPQKGYASPPRAFPGLPAPRGSRRSRRLGARFQVERHLLQNRPPAAGSRPSPPSQAPSGPAHALSPSLPEGRAVPLTSAELAGTPAAHPAPARPPRASAADLASFSSTAAAGSPFLGSRGRGGRGGERLGPGGVPAGWPHKGEARRAAPPRAPFNAPSRSLRPARRLKAERRRGSAARGRAQEMTSAGSGSHLSAPLRSARPVPSRAVGPVGGGLSRSPSPSSLRRPPPAATRGGEGAPGYVLLPASVAPSQEGRKTSPEHHHRQRRFQSVSGDL